MGLFNFIKSQFIEVIEWTDDSNDLMVYRFADGTKEINMGAQLTVRESQVAVFVNEGQLADVFTPGRYELTTENMPILTVLKSWKYGFRSPFKSEVYFVNTRQFTDQKWGTANPVMMRDVDFGVMRVRGFGIYSFRVADAAQFLREVFGTQAEFTVEGINGQLRKTLVSLFSEVLGEAKIPALQLASQYSELSDLIAERAREAFTQLGLELVRLVVENISLPEEVEKAIDARSQMNVVGDLNSYTQFQTATAIGKSGDRPGGGGLDGAGLGVGLGLGAAVAQTMAGAFQPKAPTEPAPQAVPAPTAASDAVACPSCGNMVGANVKFCPECGKAMQTVCQACGKPVGTAKFCPECGAKVER